MDLTQLNARLEEIRTESRTLADLIVTENRSFTEDEQTRFDALLAEADRIKQQIATQQRVAALEAERTATNLRSSTLGAGNAPRVVTQSRTTTPQVTDEHRALAMQAWFYRNITDQRPLTERHNEACQLVGIDPTSRELVLTLPSTRQARQIRDAWRSGPKEQAEYRALSVMGATTGSTITAPESIAAQIEINLLKFGGILELAETIRTSGRERLRWPTANDTSNKGRRLGESAAVAELNPAFGAVYWDAYKYTSDEILTPYELLSGTPYNLPDILGNMLGERIARKLADDFTTGLGVNQPKGIAVAAGATSAASATAIAWDDLETLITSVDPSHRMGGSFMFHDNIRSALAKLKDGMGRPLWAEGPNGTLPTLLKGYPWAINQSMDSSISSGKKTISFGNHSKYKVRMVGEIRLYRLIERHRENDQDAFLAFVEADGNLLDAGTDPVKILTH